MGCASSLFLPLLKIAQPPARPGLRFQGNGVHSQLLILRRGRGVEDQDGKCYPAADFPHKLQQLLKKMNLEFLLMDLEICVTG